jgi:two-component system, chemotaxis family, protein-glutamate methylesterase/glutaminase
MGEAILKSLAKPTKKIKIPDELIKEAKIAERVDIGIDLVKELGTSSLYSCPDCGGGLWEIGRNGEKSYRCHVGHAFTQQSLIEAMEASTETALWTALRIIEERRNLLKSIAEKEKGRKGLYGNYKTRIEELEKQTDLLKKVLFANVGEE